jgi:hypothetical protein
MATINLGRIKPVFRGAYAGGTAYVVDDIVTHGNESFICIQAGTGNATSNASYWTKLAAKGADGSNGTDIGTTLTTQGDILYRDGSGLQRLAKGTAGQVLKMNAAANAPEYGTISSDYVKLAAQTLDGSGLGSFEFQNCFSSANDALYGGYHLQTYFQTSSNHGLSVRYLTGTNTELDGATHYRYAGTEGFRQTNNSNNTSGPTNDGDGVSSMPWDGWGQNAADNTTEGAYYKADFQGAMYGGTGQNRSCFVNMSNRDSSSPNYIVAKFQGFRYEGSSNITGLKFYMASGNMLNGQCTLWGLKK